MRLSLFYIDDAQIWIIPIIFTKFFTVKIKAGQEYYIYIVMHYVNSLVFSKIHWKKSQLIIVI